MTHIAEPRRCPSSPDGANEIGLRRRARSGPRHISRVVADEGLVVEGVSTSTGGGSAEERHNIACREFVSIAESEMERAWI
jgi:hypothetical protein